MFCTHTYTHTHTRTHARTHACTHAHTHTHTRTRTHTRTQTHTLIFSKCIHMLLSFKSLTYNLFFSSFRCQTVSTLLSFRVNIRGISVFSSTDSNQAAISIKTSTDNNYATDNTSINKIYNNDATTYIYSMVN